MNKLISALFISFFSMVVFTPQQAAAASTAINFSPKSGTFDKPFTVDLIVDGHGEKFNAAQATIAVSENLKISDIQLGDCHFAFLTTPTVQKPSFEGVILSDYSQKCTVYSLTLVPVKKGKADLSIAKASVRRYGDAVEILATKQGSSYTLTGVAKDAVVLGDQTADKNGRYKVNVKISAENNAVSNAKVKLYSVEKKVAEQSQTDKNGIVTFANLKEGIYDVVVEQHNTKVGENIINVTGANKVLSIGINLDIQKSNPLLKSTTDIFTKITTSPYILGGILVFGVLLGAGISWLIKLLAIKIKKHKTG